MNSKYVINVSSFNRLCQDEPLALFIKIDGDLYTVIEKQIKSATTIQLKVTSADFSYNNAKPTSRTETIIVNMNPFDSVNVTIITSVSHTLYKLFTVIQWMEKPIYFDNDEEQDAFIKSIYQIEHRFEQIDDFKI